MKPKFGPGDKVFAKVRGYPPWPARVEGLADETPNRMRYHVYFYGTGETAVVKAEDICSFVDNRARLGKPKKHKNFTDALHQIEAELSPAEKVTLEQQQSAAENESEDSTLDDTGINSSRRSSTSSKSGRVSSPGKSREKKRKLEGENIVAEDSESKKGKASNSQGNAVDSDLMKSSPEVMSRSGRKIKPKRFADFEDRHGEDASGNQPRTTVIKPFNTVIKPKVSPVSGKSDSPDKPPSEKALPEEFKEEFLTAEVNDEKIQIPLKLNRPLSGDQKSIRDWQTMVYKYAFTVKKRLEAGETLPTPIDKHMDDWTKDKLKTYEADQEDREQKIAQLKIETQLLDIDTRIKSSLSLNKADPDKCLQLMDEVLDLNINALMLKKHPEVVETVKKMRKYVGNSSQWTMSEDELLNFDSKAALIRSKSEHVYNKFKSMFLVPNGKSFWEIFAKELDTFNKKTENLSMEAVFSMVHEPE